MTKPRGPRNYNFWGFVPLLTYALLVAPAYGAALQAAVRPSEIGSQTTLASKIDTVACSISTGFAPFAWPLLGFVIVWLVAFNARVGRLFGLLPRFVHKIRASGIEIEINADAAKEVRANFRASYEEFVKSAKEEYDRMADARSIRELLRSVMVDALPEVLKQKGIDYNSDDVRATIHVPDIVFQTFLYQLVNYFPASQSAGKAGRRFSQRYGIIGQSWRSNESLGRGTAVSGMGPSPTPGDRERAIKELIRRWGMTEEEASQASRERPATLSVMLRHDGQSHGILYIDSKNENAFGADSEHREDALTAAPIHNSANDVARALESHRATVKLSRAVAEVLEPLRMAAPFLEVGQ